jgi:hypothetical protein
LNIAGTFLSALSASMNDVEGGDSDSYWWQCPMSLEPHRKFHNIIENKTSLNSLKIPVAYPKSR